MKLQASRAAYYWRVWKKGITIHFGVLTTSRLDFAFFFVGKITRMLFFFVFFLSLFSVTPSVAGYSKGEVLLFFATMNLIDLVVQLVWYRGLTEMPRMIKRGDFDFLLTKPLSPLFQTAFRIFDFFDLTTLPVALGLLWYAIASLPGYGAVDWTLYAIFLANGLLLAFALNIFLASLTFWTIESSNLWWLYRDLVYVARMPPEVFPRAVRLTFTYAIPIFVIVAFPTKALLGRITPAMASYALALSALAFLGAWRMWHRGLRAYSSASS